jgi:hypothetical protein
MDYKELWLVRHTETVTPDSYDFDLSRKGKRNARILSWYMAAQNVASPTVIVYFDYQRGRSMVVGLKEHLKNDPRVEIATGQLPKTVPHDQLQCFNKLFRITKRMDDLKSTFDGRSPAAVIYVIHRLYEPGFDLLRFMLASDASKDLRDISEEQLNQHGNRFGKVLRDHSRHAFCNGELVRIRFPISSWKDLEIGSGEVAAHITPKTIRPAFKAWRQEQRALRQTRA